MKLIFLKLALLSSWSIDTAYKHVWDKDNPSLNQCAVTALVIQDYFGGNILQCPTSDGDSHFWNLLPSGEEEDLTKDQFDHTQYYPKREQKEIVDRAKLLSNPDTLNRYLLLKKRVGSFNPDLI